MRAAAETMASMVDPDGRRTVLVVDDEPTISEIVARYLERAGYATSTAADGLEAIRLVDESRPDLVVLDVMLPDLDGFEVIRLMRENGSRTPVVFLTARDATDDKIRGLTLGGDDYVTKPFSLEELVARARAVLRRAGDSQPSAKVLKAADIVVDRDTRTV